MTVETFWPYGVGPGPLDELLTRFFRDLSADSYRLARLLTEDSIELLRLAVRQAGRWGNPNVDTEHLLWAATQIDDSRGFLDHEEFQPGRIARSMEGTGEHDDRLRTEQLAFAPAARRALLEARRISWAFGDRFVDPTHIVLALAADPDDAAGQVLSDTGLPDQVPVRYGRDLTALARAERLDPVIDRHEEISRLVEALSGSVTPVLVGEPGVGKAAVVKGFARWIVGGTAPRSLRHKRVLQAERLDDVLRAFDGRDDELVVGLDGLARESIVANPSDGVRTVVAGTPDEYDQVLEEDPDLERRLLPIVVREASVRHTVDILRAHRDGYAAHHRVRFDDTALVAATELADRYISEKSLPAKAIDLLDLVGAYVGAHTKVVPHNVTELERLLAESARNGVRDVPTVTRDHVAEVVAHLVDVPAPRLR